MSRIDPFTTCGCGKPTRYMVGNPDVLSCNKHFRCPTYDELGEMAKNRYLALRELVEAGEIADLAADHAVPGGWERRKQALDRAKALLHDQGEKESD